MVNWIALAGDLLSLVASLLSLTAVSRARKRGPKR